MGDVAHSRTMSFQSCYHQERFFFIIRFLVCLVGCSSACVPRYCGNRFAVCFDRIISCWWWPRWHQGYHDGSVRTDGFRNDRVRRAFYCAGQYPVAYMASGSINTLLLFFSSSSSDWPSDWQDWSRRTRSRTINQSNFSPTHFANLDLVLPHPVFL